MAGLAVVPALVLLFQWGGVLEPLGMPKVWLLSLCVLVWCLVLLYFVIKQEKQISLTAPARWAPLAVLAVSWLGAVTVSTVTSVSGFSSALGLNGLDHTSMVFYVVLVVFSALYLLGGSDQRAHRSLQLFLGALSVASLSDSAALATQNSLIFTDTPAALGVLSVSGFVLLLYLAISPQSSKLARRIAFVLAGLLLLPLLLLDLSIVWALLALSVLVILGLFVAHPRFSVKGAFSGLLIAAFSLSVVFSLFASPVAVAYPAQVVPSPDLTLHVARESLTGPRLLFGTGPGTFTYNYIQHKPEYVNETAFWNTGFKQGYSYLLTLIATLGVIPMLTALAGLMYLGYEVIVLSRSARTSGFLEPSMLGIALMVSVSGLVLLPGSVLTVWLSVVIALQILSQQPGVTVHMRRANALAALVLCITVFASIVSILTVRALSETAFVSALDSQHVQSASATRDQLDRAASLFPVNDVMYRNLAYSLLLSSAAELSASEPNDTQAARYLALAVDSAQKATKLNPAQATNWEMLGTIYSELIPIDGNADVLAIEAYSEASMRAPTNPRYLLATGKLRLIRFNKLGTLAQGDPALEVVRQGELESAKVAIQSAYELRPSLSGLGFYLAQIHMYNKETEQAIGVLENAKAAGSLDAQSAIQLAVLYLDAERYADARTLLLALIAQDPEFSNARWYLATVYEFEGDIESALEQLRLVERLNPSNEQVLERISLLSGLQPTLGPVLPEPLSDPSESVQ